MTKTINDIYLDIRKIFKQNDICSAELEARELVAFATNTNRKDTTLWAHSYITQERSEILMKYVERRLNGEPIAYIIGEWDFYGLTFKVTKDVLIPRNDTETLAGYAINIAESIYNPRILDLCCGSGCIGISMLKNIDDAKVVAVDISDKALLVARENAREHKVIDRYISINTSASIPYDGKLGKFHIICCNPPYIPSDDIWKLDNAVRDFEPHIALDGGKDGMNFYRNIIQHWKLALESGGILIFECGINQPPLVAEMMNEFGFSDIKIISDLSEKQRVVSGKI